MRNDQISTTTTGDNLDRLLGLLHAARAEEATRVRVNTWMACRELLAVIEADEPSAQAA